MEAFKPMAKRPDGVIVAVRYASDGKIAIARIFERRGATYSDRVHITREALVERLKNKKRFVVGKRTVYMAGTFETGAEVRYLAADVVATNPEAKNDMLEGTPVF
jgi:hypothetical protein